MRVAVFGAHHCNPACQRRIAVFGGTRIFFKIFKNIATNGPLRKTSFRAKTAGLCTHICATFAPHPKVALSTVGKGYTHKAETQRWGCRKWQTIVSITAIYGQKHPVVPKIALELARMMKGPEMVATLHMQIELSPSQVF